MFLPPNEWQIKRNLKCNRSICGITRLWHTDFTIHLQNGATYSSSKAYIYIYISFLFFSLPINVGHIHAFCRHILDGSIKGCTRTTPNNRNFVRLNRYSSQHIPHPFSASPIYTATFLSNSVSRLLQLVLALLGRGGGPRYSEITLAELLTVFVGYWIRG